MTAAQLTPFLDVPLEVEALVEGPRMSVRDLLALKAGSLIETDLAAGENVEILAGDSLIGTGELGAARGQITVRFLQFEGEK